MNKNKFYTFVIALLLVSNLLLALLFFQEKGSRFHPDKPRNAIIEKLNFDENQIQKYDALIQNHRTQIRAEEYLILTLKNKLYQNLNKEQDLIQVTAITEQIAKVQQNIETIHYKHFSDIKKLCKPEQLNNFNELVNELTQLFNHKPTKRK